MKINIEKIKQELLKGNPNEQHEAYEEIKSFISENLIKHQEELANLASHWQSKIDKIKNV